MEQLYTIKVGEICLKGGNRNQFENQLKNNVRKSFLPAKIKIWGGRGRFYLKTSDIDPEIVKETLTKIFGIVAYCPTFQCEKDMESIKRLTIDLCRAEKTEWRTFKVEARRADKTFPLSSYEIASELGHIVLEKFPDKQVKMKNPEVTIHIEIRDVAYMYLLDIPCPGGLPVGSAGKGMLMLSGGIDSPIAGYLMAKRGLRQDAVYFHTYPYTSDETKEKVVNLAKVLSPYLQGLRLFVVPFTKVQMKIKKDCKESETTLHMRCAMMQITDILARKNDALAIVTGEALSQVASQTAQSLRVTDNATDFPVLRPVIGFDKEEIITIAKKIGTYETSILPFDDCCAMFSPDHPVIKPDFQKLSSAYTQLGLDELLHEAAEQVEIIKC